MRIIETLIKNKNHLLKIHDKLKLIKLQKLLITTLLRITTPKQRRVTNRILSSLQEQISLKERQELKI